MISFKVASFFVSCVSAGILSMVPITWQDQEYLIQRENNLVLVKKGRVSTLLSGPSNATHYVYVASCPSKMNHYSFSRSEIDQQRLSGLDGVRCLLGNYQREDERLGIKRLFVSSSDEEIINQASRKFQKSLK